MVFPFFLLICLLGRWIQKALRERGRLKGLKIWVEIIEWLFFYIVISDF